MTPTPPRPGYDPEIEPALAALHIAPIVTAKDIAVERVQFAPTVDQALAGRPIDHEERTIAGPGGGDLVLSVFRPAARPSPSTADAASPRGAPGILYAHGGGMFAGNRFAGISEILSWVLELGAVFVSVEYRRAPEHPDPAPVEDCYAGLVWMQAHADELGIDPGNLSVAGASAGGGLAAGTALLARDRGGTVALRAQVLICPMLDDRHTTPSSRQWVDDGAWSRTSNETGWHCLLGERCGGVDSVSIYAAPARATDLSGLPPALIDVGAAEIFRDEAVAYASLLWQGGGQAELHVWGGGCHGFDLLVPEAALSKTAIETRLAWARRVLAPASAP